VVYFNELAKGGHFEAFEQPETFDGGGEGIEPPPEEGPQPLRIISQRILLRSTHPDQSNAARFLVTNSSTVIGWRPPISAI
jgi:hypothetical protein